MITFHMRGATRSTGWLSISDTRRSCCTGRGAWFVFVSAQFSNPTPGTRLALYRPKRRVAYGAGGYVTLQAVMVFPLKHFVTRKKYGRLNINHVIRMDRRMDLGRGSKWARAGQIFPFVQRSENKQFCNTTCICELFGCSSVILKRIYLAPQKDSEN